MKYVHCRRSKKSKNRKTYYLKTFFVKEETVTDTKKSFDDEDTTKLQEISIIVDEILYHQKDIDYDKVSEYLTLLENTKKMRKLSESNFIKCEKSIRHLKIIKEVMTNELNFSNMSLYNMKDKTPQNKNDVIVIKNNTDSAANSSQETYCSELENLNCLEKEIILSKSIDRTNKNDNNKANLIDLTIKSNKDNIIFPTIDLISQISDKENNVTIIHKNAKIDSNTSTTKLAITPNIDHFGETNSNSQDRIIFVNTSKKLTHSFGKSSYVEKINKTITKNTEILEKHDKNFYTKSKSKRNKNLDDNSMFTLHFNKTLEDNFNSPPSEDIYNVDNTMNDLGVTQVRRSEINNVNNMKMELEISEVDFDLEISNNIPSNNTKNNFIDKNKTQNSFQYNKTLPIKDNIIKFKQTIVDKLLVLRDNASYDRKYSVSQQSGITNSYESLFQKRSPNIQKVVKKSEKLKRQEKIYQEIEKFVNEKIMNK